MEKEEIAQIVATAVSFALSQIVRVV